MSNTTATSRIEPAERTAWVRSRRAMPAWAMSLLIHATLVVVLTLTIQNVSRGISDEPARSGSVVLAERSEDKTEYFDGSQTADSNDVQVPAESANSVAQSLPAVDLPPSDLGSLLPSGEEALTGDTSDGLPSAGGLTEGGAPSKSGLGNKGTTSVFGAEGSGSKFVYVFDRSGSMNVFGGRPLLAAKQELIQSIRDLNDLQQFSIIFYNENPQVFSPRGQGPELIFADEQGTNLAERFVRGIIASGGTQHVDAMLLALNMRPDVIFFLTDADQPQLFPSELETIRKRNHGCTIHAIEFGYGPFNGNRNFLVKLADENGGQHVYVDISKLQPKSN